MKILHVFKDVHMCYSHLGLANIARSKKIDVHSLPAGEFVVFINKRLNAVKIFTANNIIAYLRSPDGRRLEMKTVEQIPSFFRGGAFDYNAALEKVLLKRAE